MRKTHILATASMLALGAMISWSPVARADGEDEEWRPKRSQFVDTFAFAANTNDVSRNTAITTGGSAAALISGSGLGARGVLQFNQNVGPNSELQNAAAVASIVAHARAGDIAVAMAINSGRVTGNRSSRGECGQQCGGGTLNSATIVNSYGGAMGILQVNQNAGDNSLLQNSAALASFRYCGERCTTANLRAVAVAVNSGNVTGNFAEAHRSTALATIAGSFNGAQGIVNVNQNAGANSLLQNSTAVASIRPSSP